MQQITTNKTLGAHLFYPLASDSLEQGRPDSPVDRITGEAFEGEFLGLCDAAGPLVDTNNRLTGRREKFWASGRASAT